MAIYSTMRHACLIITSSICRIRGPKRLSSGGILSFAMLSGLLSRCVSILGLRCKFLLLITVRSRLFQPVGEQEGVHCSGASRQAEERCIGASDKGWEGKYMPCELMYIWMIPVYMEMFDCPLRSKRSYEVHSTGSHCIFFKYLLGRVSQPTFNSSFSSSAVIILRHLYLRQCLLLLNSSLRQ